VEQVAIYRTLRPAALAGEAAAALADRRVDWITFASSSAVESFVALAAEAGADLEGINLAAIGPVTAQALADHALEATVMAYPHTIDALLEAIVTYEKGDGSRFSRARLRGPL
jgi:uroporphyrinogen III methyltransferase/synthase